MQRASSELLGELDQVGRLAGDDLDRHRSPAQRPPAIAMAIGPSARSAGVPSSASTSIVSSTGAVGDVLVELLVEALDHRAELELGRRLAQPAAVRRSSAPPC